MPPIDGEQGSLPATDAEATAAATEVIAPVAGEGDTPAPAPKTDAPASSSEAKPSGEAAKPATDERKTLLDATRAALKTTVNAVVPSTTAKTDTPADKGAAATPDGTGKPAATDDKTLPFHNHPRWKEVLAERDGFRGDAEQHRKVVSFMTNQKLEPQEVAEGMILMGMMKNDPEKALERLLPHVTRLQELLGKALPADLQKQVDEGLTTEEVARETAQLRRKAEAATAHATKLDTEQRRDNAGRFVQSLKSAVDTWEATMRKGDPDFAVKAAPVQDRVLVLISQKGQPKSPAQALEYVKEAYKTVSDRMKGQVQQRKTNAAPAGTHGSHAAAPVPKTLADAVRFAAGHR